MDKPVIAQKSPYAVEVEAGKTYFWCACGLSKNAVAGIVNRNKETTFIDLSNVPRQRWGTAIKRTVDTITEKAHGKGQEKTVH